MLEWLCAALIVVHGRSSQPQVCRSSVITVDEEVTATMLSVLKEGENLAWRRDRVRSSLSEPESLTAPVYCASAEAV